MKTRRTEKKLVVLRFVGSLRGASGRSQITFEIEKSFPLIDIIKELSQQTPQLSRIFAQSENRKLTSNMLILINGREISALNGLDTILQEGDEVVFVPVVHGG
jgi:molybdopterin synthase sulfur carrier subunit